MSADPKHTLNPMNKAARTINVFLKAKKKPDLKEVVSGFKKWAKKTNTKTTAAELSVYVAKNFPYLSAFTSQMANLL